jgi:hypothetical protein
VPTPRRRNLAWLWYSLIRVALFALILWILLQVLPIDPIITTVIAAVIAFCLSYIFLSGPRAAVSQQIDSARRSAASPSRDESDEDAELGSEGERGTETHAVDQAEQAGQGEGQDQLPRGARGDGDEPGRHGE